MLEYKGYTGEITIDFETKILFGRVSNIKDVVTFKAESVEKMIEEFHKSVDDYIDFISSD